MVKEHGLHLLTL